MKCKHCDGTGKTNMYKDGEFVACMYCGGTGEVEQTNEEWLRSCTTEQLVDAIFDCTMANSWNFSKNGIKRWLKQPHTKE